MLERVESKVDRLGTPVQASNNFSRLAVPGAPAEPSETGPQASWEHIEADTRQQDRRGSETFLPTELVSASTHLTAAHRILLWPSVYLTMTNHRVAATKDIHLIMQEGTPWFTHLELKKHPLPLPAHVSSGTPTNPSHSPRSFTLGFNGLTIDSTRQLVDAYFDSFNVLHPILDRDLFYTDVVLPVIRGGYEDRDGPTCLIMLVLALGRVAIDGVSGPPISNATHPKSGIRGGTEGAPPGIEFLSEARRRIGFIMHDCSLENVQIYLLQATYYEACARHMDYWRSCASASMAFQVYIRCERIDWSTPRADLIKRVYWTCILHEDLYHLELDLPRTGIYNLEDKVPLPSFGDARAMISNNSHDSSNSYYHFLAMTALRRLIARIHETLHSDSVKLAENNENYEGPPVHLIKELARQLEAWRTFLPQPLQWSDADAHSFPNLNPLSRTPPGPLFTPESMSPAQESSAAMGQTSSQYGGSDSGASAAGGGTGGVVGGANTHRFNLDIVTGHLRTRFYYSRYLIYRPFIFKALHFPEAVTQEDAAYCGLAMQSACVWPLAMAPCRDKKRLVPHLFTWTQHFLGILLLMRVADDNECLRRICEEHVSQRDMFLTVGLLLDWLNDMRAVDGVAEWAWTVVEPLFPGYTKQ